MAQAHEHRGEGEANLLVVAALISAFMVAEVVVGALAGSLALLADAGHMLTDAGALAAALWATRLARRPATSSMTFGFKRAEVLSAALNGLALLAVAIAVAVDAVLRLLHPAPVDGLALVAMAAIGVAVNLVASMVLSRADRSRFTVAGVLAHVVSDLWAFLGTFVAGLFISLGGYYRADPAASLAVVGLMGWAAWRLLRRSGRVLLEGSPEGVDLEEIRNHLLSLPEVLSVHDLHAWVVTSDLPAVSAHVVVSDQCLLGGGTPQLLDELQACLAGHFDVEHSTFQLEAAGHLDHEAAQHD